MGLIRQLYRLFSRRERWQLLLLSLGLVVRAGMETIGVASIAPFMSAVADPDVIHRNKWLSAAYAGWGFTSDTSFLFALGLTVVLLLAVNNLFSATALWGLLRFSWGAYHRLAMRLLEGYLNLPYEFFVERNSASLNKTLLSEVGTVVNGILVHVLNSIARVLVVLALGSFLIALNPALAGTAFVLLGGVYGSMYMLIKKKQRQLGLERLRATEDRFRISGEAFGGIKDVKVLYRESAFLKRFAGPSWRFSRAMAANGAVTQLPKYLLETLAFGGIVLVILFYLKTGWSLAGIIPALSLYAFAGYRLMPEFQQLFGAIAAVRFNRAALDNLTRDLEMVAHGRATSRPSEGSVRFNREIQFEGVTFSYAGAELPAIKNASLTIRCRQTVGLVGASGSGKTTLVDLLLALHVPQAGRILIDGFNLHDGLVNCWRHQVGYVPQQVFLCDDTIGNNVAFGIPSREIDPDCVLRAVKTAHLDDFIRDLPQGLDTVVGERGVRLSGGQRQRIGIARALYHDPPVLVMDEATSSLDSSTESGVMQAIGELSGTKTIVIIAHRFSTIAKCDAIVLMESGRVADVGTFEELFSRNPLFRKLAAVESLVQAGASSS